MKMSLNIEEQLREAILNAGISRYRLAKLTGVTQGVLSQFVRARRSITLNTGAKLAVALKLGLKPMKPKKPGRRARKGR